MCVVDTVLTFGKVYSLEEKPQSIRDYGRAMSGPRIEEFCLVESMFSMGSTEQIDLGLTIECLGRAKYEGKVMTIFKNPCVA